jgi:hypothetical protein
MQHSKICHSCKEKSAEKRRNLGNKENLPQRKDGRDTSPQGPPLLRWDSFVSLLGDNKHEAFELHAFVTLNEDSPHSQLASGHDIAIAIAKSIKEVTGFRFKCVPFHCTPDNLAELLRSYKKKRISPTSDNIVASTFYCAQLKGEETKTKVIEDRSKRRARMTMERFACNGWLHVTTNNEDLKIVNIRITHHQCHIPYTDISMSDDIAELVRSMKDDTAAKVT